MVAVVLLGGVAAIAWVAAGRYALRWLPPQASPLAPTGPRRGPGRAEIGALVVVFALAVGLRLPLMTRGFGYDELWSAVEFIGAESTWQTVSSFREYNNHVFYSLSARASSALFGRAEWALRLPALLFGLATVPALWLAARWRFGAVPAIGAAFGIATSAIHVGFSASARGYTGLVLLSLVSSALFLRWLRDGASRSLVVGYVAASVLGIYTHLYAAVVVGVQVLLLLVLARAGRLRAGRLFAVWCAFATIGFLSALCYAPVLRQILNNLAGGPASAFRPLLPLDVLAYLAGYAEQAVGLFLAAAVVAGWAWCARRSSHVRLEALYVTLLFGLPLTAAWLARPEYLRGRFFLFVLPYYALGLAVAPRAVAHTLRARLPRRPAIAVVAAAFLGAAIAGAWASRPWSNVPTTGGFREAVAALDAPAGGLRVGACGLGLGPHLYAWYATRPVFVPPSEEAFEAWARQHDEVRCAYNPSRADTPAHTRIARALAERAEPERFFTIQVLRVAPASPPP